MKRNSVKTIKILSVPLEIIDYSERDFHFRFFELVPRKSEEMEDQKSMKIKTSTRSETGILTDINARKRI